FRSGRTPGCGRYGAVGRFGAGYFLHRMRSQEGCQMLAHTNRAHARAATTVGNTEGFMQVQVRDVPTELARSGNADPCVHISAVDIDLTPHRGNHIAQFSDAFFKDAVSRAIVDPDAANLLTVGGDFCPQGDEVHVTLAVTGNHSHFKTDYLG